MSKKEKHLKVSSEVHENIKKIALDKKITMKELVDSTLRKQFKINKKK